MKSTFNDVLDFKNEIPSDSVSEAPPPYSLDGRLVHIYYNDWLMKGAKIFDSDKTTPLYNISLRCRKPHLRITSGSSDCEIGEVRFHWFKRRIDVILHSQQIPMNAQGGCKSTYSYESPTLGHATLSWKLQSKWKDPLRMILLDANDTPVARFEPTYRAKRKAGKFELYGSSAEPGPMMDEVVVTGLAVAQYRVQQMQATSGASALT